MTEFKKMKIVTEVNEVIAITCDKCGDRREVMSRFDEVLQNFHDFRASGGYYSTFPQDMDEVSFTLCSDCLKQFVTSFKIPVPIIHLLPFD